MMTEDPYFGQRERMVTTQIERRGLHSPRLLEALRRVPRHRFVPTEMHPYAYEDGPLPIGCGQTISQPYIVALMTSLLDLQGEETILEIGTGSGYQAAVLACLAGKVHTVERQASLAERSATLLFDLGFNNVFVHPGDGSLGWPEFAPYQAIMVTAAAPQVPEPLLQQLADGGRLVIPVGARFGQDLQLWTRQGSRFDYESIIPVAFVPLRGAHGWHDEPSSDW